jgi:hypothetical protein
MFGGKTAGSNRPKWLKSNAVGTILRKLLKKQLRKTYLKAPVAGYC